MEPHMWSEEGFRWMWIFPFMFMILFMAVCLFWIFRRPGGWSCPICGWNKRGIQEQETPRQILDRRLASGEITKEQYEEIKLTLEH